MGKQFKKGLFTKTDYDMRVGFGGNLRGVWGGLLGKPKGWYKKSWLSSSSITTSRSKVVEGWERLLKTGRKESYRISKLKESCDFCQGHHEPQTPSLQGSQEMNTLISFPTTLPPWTSYLLNPCGSLNI